MAKIITADDIAQIGEHLLRCFTCSSSVSIQRMMAHYGHSVMIGHAIKTTQHAVEIENEILRLHAHASKLEEKAYGKRAVVFLSVKKLNESFDGYFERLTGF